MYVHACEVFHHHDNFMIIFVLVDISTLVNIILYDHVLHEFWSSASFIIFIIIFLSVFLVYQSCTVHMIV